MQRQFHIAVLLCLLMLAAAGQPRLTAAESQSQNEILTSFVANRVYVPAVYMLGTLAPAAPSLLAEVNGPGKGRVWIGAAPANGAAKPVLVFVHGLHGSAQSWWGPTAYSGVNDMYALAYASGYRTAFVSLDDEIGGPASSMWVTGATLNRQLDVVLKHFGVASVNIVAHSKGGVDANSAVIHAGAHGKVQAIVTLSTPHHGSQVADLAYSWWAGWLSELLGQRDDGTYVLQTSYMRNFRSQTDARPENAQVRFVTAAGTDHGPALSSLWYAGSYLNTYGPNDGLVTVASSNHPRQYARGFTTNLNHDNIRKGSAVWQLIEPVLRATEREASPEQDLKALSPAVSPSEASAMILRGGQLNQPMERLRLPVEGSVHKLTFDLLSQSSALEVTLIDPHGVRYHAAAPVPDQGVFRGGWHYVTTQPTPQAGEWTVELRGDRGAAFLLVATVDSPLEVAVTRAGVVLPTEQINVGVRVQANGKPAPEVAVAVRLTGTPLGKERVGSMSTQLGRSGRGQGSVTAQLEAPAVSGLYQLGITVTGVAPDGTVFERSFPDNLAVRWSQQFEVAPLPPGR